MRIVFELWFKFNRTEHCKFNFKNTIENGLCKLQAYEGSAKKELDLLETSVCYIYYGDSISNPSNVYHFVCPSIDKGILHFWRIVFQIVLCWLTGSHNWKLEFDISCNWWTIAHRAEV